MLFAVILKHNSFASQYFKSIKPLSFKKRTSLIKLSMDVTAFGVKFFEFFYKVNFIIVKIQRLFSLPHVNFAALQGF